MVFILPERVFWWLMKTDCVHFCVVSFGHTNTVYVEGVKRPGRVADHAPHLMLSLRMRAALPSQPPVPLWHVEGHLMLIFRGQEDYCRLILTESVSTWTCITDFTAWKRNFLPVSTSFCQSV